MKKGKKKKRIVHGISSEMSLLYKFLLYKATYLSDGDVLLCKKRRVPFSEVIQGHICQ